MSVLFVISAFSLIPVNDDFLSLAVGNDLTLYRSVFHIVTDFKSFIAYCNNIVECDFFSGFESEFFNLYDISLGYLVLLSAGLIGIMNKALSQDSNKGTAVDITPLGIMEITRARRGRTFDEIV